MTAANERADELAARGDLAGAAREIEQVLEQQPGSLGNWLKLAGLRRALKQPRRALEAVHRALALSPLDFMALVMRAQLLERLGDPGASEAWQEALAQEPDGTLPPPLAAAVAHGSRPATPFSPVPRTMRPGASRAFATTFCARPGSIAANRRIFTFRACPNASSIRARSFPSSHSLKLTHRLSGKSCWPCSSRTGRN